MTPAGTERHGKVVITHRNALTPLSPWVSAAHVSLVSLNQGSFYTAAGVRCVNVRVGCEKRVHVILCVCGTESVHIGEIK